MADLFGQNLQGLAAYIQTRSDEHLLNKISDAGNMMEKYSEQLQNFRNFIVELQAYRGDEADMDLSPMADRIEAFKEQWESLREFYPDLDECPISDELDLTKVSTKDLDAIERKVDNMNTRMQNKYPKLMLDIEMHTNLHKLISDIMMQISKSHIETGRVYTRNQRTN